VDLDYQYAQTKPYRKRKGKRKTDDDNEQLDRVRANTQIKPYFKEEKKGRGKGRYACAFRCQMCILTLFERKKKGGKKSPLFNLAPLYRRFLVEREGRRRKENRGDDGPGRYSLRAVCLLF